MLKDPIRIKRPVIVVDGPFIQGFDDQRLRPCLGGWDGSEDIITCPQPADPFLRE